MFNYVFIMTVVVIIIIDYIYLTMIKGYFKQQIKQVQMTHLEVNILGALLCYLFLAIGIYYFIIKPQKTISEAFLLGIIIYGVYESTNYALFKKWSILTVIIDTLWGGFLFAISTYIIKIINEI